MQTDLESSLFFLFVLFVSIIVHEVAHGYAAYALGDPTAKHAGRLTLNPLAHIDLVGTILVPAVLVLTHAGMLFGWAKPVPYNPYNLKNQRWGEAIVGSAGVLTNLILAVIFALITRYTYSIGMTDFANLSAIVALVNLFLGMFNLIPFPPLDGYTVLRGVLPYNMTVGLRQFETSLMRGGFITLILFLIIFSTFLIRPFSQLVYMVFAFLVGG